MRVSEEQKAKAVEHYLKKPMTLKVLHGEEGSADKQWVSVSKAVLPVLLRDTP